MHKFLNCSCIEYKNEYVKHFKFFFQPKKLLKSRYVLYIHIKKKNEMQIVIINIHKKKQNYFLIIILKNIDK